MFDNYLYVIDPRSVEYLEQDIDYNDDYIELNASVTKDFEAGIIYYIVYGQYNPKAPFNDYDTGDDIDIYFNYLQE